MHMLGLVISSDVFGSSWFPDQYDLLYNVNHPLRHSKKKLQVQDTDSLLMELKT